jgi:hypothetical protein
MESAQDKGPLSGLEKEVSSCPKVDEKYHNLLFDRWPKQCRSFQSLSPCLMLAERPQNLQGTLLCCRFHVYSCSLTINTDLVTSSNVNQDDGKDQDKSEEPPVNQEQASEDEPEDSTEDEGDQDDEQDEDDEDRSEGSLEDSTQASQTPERTSAAGQAAPRQAAPAANVSTQAKGHNQKVCVCTWYLA